MRRLLFAVLVVFAGAVCGCGPVKPMSESEFRGFCYQYGDGSQGGGCGDIIAICDEYSTVINMSQGSQSACREACRAIARPQARRYTFTGCEGGVAHAVAWCERYCRSAYQK